MSSPTPGGKRPPLRVLGVGLVAVAVGLVGVGVVATGGSGSSDTAAQGPSTTAAAITTTPAPETSASPVAPPATTTTPRTTTATPPVTTTTPSPSSGVAPTSTAAPSSTGLDGAGDRVVRVFNNSLISGLGQRAAADIRGSGWDVVQVGNFQGRFPVTTVYYRPGTSEEGAAQELASGIGATAAPRIDAIASFAPGLIVVVTQDFTG